MTAAEESAPPKPPIAYTKKLPEPKLVYAIDFFCGSGGMSYGFAATRQSHLAFKMLAGIDIDGVALQTFEQNTGATGVKADIGKIGEDPDSLLRLLPEFDPDLCRPLVFIGCAPCQGFSALRKGDERDDPRNSLMMSFAKICARFKPDVVVMENVPEIISGRYSHYYQVAAAELRSAGYVLRQDVLDLSRFGVPQRRRRAVVLGALTGPIPLPPPVFSADEAPTVRHAISHLRPIASGEIDPYDPHHRAPVHSERLLERIRATPPDGGDRRSLPKEYQLDCHTNLDAGATPGFTDVYGRLRWDTPSVTITSKSRSPSSGRFLHPEQHRNISVREAAILQGFPQSFVFAGSPTLQYRHIGEAVPPLFARFLAWQVLDFLSPRQKEISALFASPRRLTRDATGDVAPRVRFVDGFCGAGGISLGFEAAGFESAFAFDIDEDAVATYRRNVGEVAERFDVRDRDLVSRLNRALGDAPYIIAGGPPCQGFSHQRRGEPDDPRNTLVLGYADLIEALENPPLAIVLENVTDLDLPRGRAIRDQFLKRLHKMGFRDFRHDLNSADYGVPQLRNRILIVAVPERIAPFYKGPSPLTPSRWTTVGETFGGLPEPPAPSLSPVVGEDDMAVTIAVENHAASQEGELNKRRIAYVDMGSGRKSIPPDLQLPCHATDYRGHRDVYGRLDWFSQARTLTSGFDSFTRGEFGHPFRHRSITPREAARIQGFPDWFAFEGNRASVRRQIGNAVPPPMAFAVAKAIEEAIRRAREEG